MNQADGYVRFTIWCCFVGLCVALILAELMAQGAWNSIKRFEWKHR